MATLAKTFSPVTSNRILPTLGTDKEVKNLVSSYLYGEQVDTKSLKAPTLAKLNQAIEYLTAKKEGADTSPYAANLSPSLRNGINKAVEELEETRYNFRTYGEIRGFEDYRSEEEKARYRARIDNGMSINEARKLMGQERKNLVQPITEQPQSTTPEQQKIPLGQQMTSDLQDVATMPVGFLQGLGNIGYNVIGKRMDKAGKALASNLEGTKLEKAIQDLAIATFGENEIRKFNAETQQKEEEGTLFDASTAADISTPLLGEERANSTTNNIGEFLGETAATLALTAPVGGAALPAYRASSTIGKILLGTAVGGLEGGIAGYATSGEAPTGGEVGLGALVGGAIPSVGGIASSVKKALPSAEATLQRLNRITKKGQQEFFKQQKTTPGKWLNDRGIVDTPENTVDKLVDYFENSIQKVDEGIEAIKGKFKPDELKEILDDSIRYADETANTDLSTLKKLKTQYDGEGLEMKDINYIKRFFERNNKFTYGKNPAMAEKTVRATNLDNQLRKRQMETAEEYGFTNLAEMNKETQASKYLLDSLTKENMGKIGNNAMSITDWIMAAPASIDPSFIAGLVGKKIFTSGRFQKGYVKLANLLNGKKTLPEKLVDLVEISKIKNEKQLNTTIKRLQNVGNLDNPALPIKQGVGSTPATIQAPGETLIGLKGGGVKTKKGIAEIGFNKAAPASVAKTMNQAVYTSKTAIYFDKNGNQISQGTYRNIKNYEKTLKKRNNIKKTKDYEVQYDTIEKLNSLAHSIARKTGDKSIEKYTYPIKNDFAIQEMDRRGSNIMKRDNNAKMYYIERENGKKSVHVGNKAERHLKKLKKGKGSS